MILSFISFFLKASVSVTPAKAIAEDHFLLFGLPVKPPMESVDMSLLV